MSRVAVREILSQDSVLNSLGITAARIWPNFALDKAPRTGGPWLILRWGSSPGRFGGVGGQRSLTIWAYQARQVTSDYAYIDAVLDRATQVLLAAEQWLASDGSVITTADFKGSSEDLIDAGYDAIAKNAAFVVVTRSAL